MEEKFDIIYPDDRGFKLEEGVQISKEGKFVHNKDLRYKYFAVLCKLAHSGKGTFIPGMLAVKAYDAKAAAQIARYVGRVKHDRKDAIIMVSEIDKRQYAQISAINDMDIFMDAHNVQDQRQINKKIAHRVMREPESAEDGLTAETELYGENHSLQNFIVGRIPYNKRANQILVETYIEENRALWEERWRQEKQVKDIIDPCFEDEVAKALQEANLDQPAEQPKPQSNDAEKSCENSNNQPKNQEDGGQGQV